MQNVNTCRRPTTLATQELDSEGHREEHRMDAEDLMPSVAFYAAETDRLRSAAKWLTTALAGVAGVLVAGLQLTDLGHLSVHHDLVRLLIAVVSIVIALGGVAWMIRQTLDVFTTRWLDLGHLQRFEFLEQYFQNAPGPSLGTHLLQSFNRRGRPPDRADDVVELLAEINRLGPYLHNHVAPTIPELQQELTAAINALTVLRDPADPDRPGAVLRLRLAREAVQGVVVYANYFQTRRIFDIVARRLVWVGLTVAMAVGVFAYAVTPN